MWQVVDCSEIYFCFPFLSCLKKVSFEITSLHFCFCWIFIFVFLTKCPILFFSCLCCIPFSFNIFFYSHPLIIISERFSIHCFIFFSLSSNIFFLYIFFCVKPSSTYLPFLLPSLLLSFYFLSSSFPSSVSLLPLLHTPGK